MKFDLHFSRISEEKFWHNYFYRVHLIRQSVEKNAKETPRPSSSAEVDKEEKGEEPEKEVGID